MNITINTDASFCHTTQAAGFAFYIVCNDFRIMKGGEFKNECKGALDAEAMAIGNALATLLAQNKTKDIKYLIINSDCIPAMTNIGDNRRGGIYKQIRKLKNRVINKFNVQKFEFRHVKAHNGSPDNRSKANEWCDKEAKKWMRKGRKKRMKKVS
jgi:ribonuclease HI